MRISYKLFLFCLLAWQQTFASEKLISFKEVQMHNIARDCWIIVNAKVYNITKFINAHDGKCNKIKLTDFCGKDASAAWIEKQESEQGHKRKSVLNFEQSQIGTVP
ncbi:MAG: cytochrome b5-like heme/steroid binding domain-containing protein [Gammaproteobacteria bacterium]